ncbi:hypothetical protein [Sellimonas intestinalis]|uniref:hypothetical protein n=1 Tax=Sellimonas intestinalis TaxID=1653434 RepID=UPI0015EBE0EC|nr:hypothetical protein [Sellimonas intestinalis]MBA2214721.1 hypothetical protein [Sellimonas intestinalis]
MSGKMEGTGIPTETDRTFEFFVLPYTCHEIESAEHIFELPASYATVLRILDMQTELAATKAGGMDSRALYSQGRGAEIIYFPGTSSWLRQRVYP